MASDKNSMRSVIVALNTPSWNINHRPLTSYRNASYGSAIFEFITYLGSEITADGDSVQLSSVQSLSRVQLFATPWLATRQASLSITNSQSLLKFMSIESVMPSNHLTLCRSLLLPSSIFPSIRVFSNESVLCIRWPKYWSLSFSISPSNEYSGLISFRIDWFDLLTVQGTFESSPTLQFQSINSWALSFLYSPTLTSIHDDWKNHSFD